MRRSTVVPLLMTLAATAAGEVRMETVKYEAAGKPMVGYLAYDESTKGRRPGVLVVHEWWGANDYAKRRARELAELGYVAFAGDMYGDGKTTNDPKQAGEWAGAVRGSRERCVERVTAALDVLKHDEHVDPNRLAAIGYCFGGTVALEAARAGGDLVGVVSFHGTLGTSEPAQAGQMKAKVLVLTGAADPQVPREQVTAFQDEMSKAHTDWQVITYADAKHSFTNPASSKLGFPAVAYNEAADRRSWRAMRSFFEEIFAAPSPQAK